MSRDTTSPESTLIRTVHRILIGCMIVISLILLILWRTDNPRLERVRMSLVDTLAPSMGWVSEPVEVAWSVARDYRNFLDVYDQNKSLRREIQSLKSWRERARLLEEENAQLRALNNVHIASRMTFVTGEVIADSGGPFLQAALVNVGRGDGVEGGEEGQDGGLVEGGGKAIQDRTGKG